jgi:hypothetical protein
MKCRYKKKDLIDKANFEDTKKQWDKLKVPLFSVFYYISLSKVHIVKNLGFTLLILYSYENYLKENLHLLPFFIFLLIANSYLMLTAGKNPGYY